MRRARFVFFTPRVRCRARLMGATDLPATMICLQLLLLLDYCVRFYFLGLVSRPVLENKKVTFWGPARHCPRCSPFHLPPLSLWLQSSLIKRRRRDRRRLQRGQTMVHHVQLVRAKPNLFRSRAPDVFRPRSQDLFWSQDLYFIYKKPVGYFGSGSLLDPGSLFHI